jgi:hypothetical protein
MMRKQIREIPRRKFLRSAACASAGLPLLLFGQRAPAAGNSPALKVGEGAVDITPPLGVEMGGFHRPPGNERRVTGIRQPTAVRALVLELADVRTAIVSLDVTAVGDAMARRIQKQVADRVGIPAENVRLAATHTHSMPGFCYLRQWGAVPVEFMATVEKKTAEAVAAAVADLAPAEVSIGTSQAQGANFNRTTKTWKTGQEFQADSSDDQRWLDTTVHALHFQRTGDRRDLLWYHFSAHPVCFADDLAGPDWPGMVAQRMQADHKLAPSFLQGHAGDVNPGDGDPWRGDADKTTRGVYAALEQAVDDAQRIDVDRLRVRSQSFAIPLDIPLLENQLARYRTDPTKCQGGEWVDAGFAKDWFDAASKYDLKRTHLACRLSALRLGDVGLVFHPGELYSFYGLAIRRGSPFAHTLSVGYTDGIVGYLPDPTAYKAGEYAAITVPKILDYPPFTPTAARELTQAAGAMLKEVAT